MGKWKEFIVQEVEEIDEDEQYVRETENGEWEEDVFVPEESEDCFDDTEDSYEDIENDEDCY